MAPLCKFWARGDCRNGERCKFEHPRDLGRSDNRFAALQTKESNSRNSFGRTHNDGRSTPPQNASYTLNREAIIADLSSERPQWILSAYGPAPKAPAQLFGGPIREQSFEEMRLHYYNGVASGNAALAIQQADALVREAETQMQTALRDVEGAMEFIRKAENDHPNRVDICQSSTNTLVAINTATSNPSAVNNAGFTQPVPGFGQPSALGAKPNPFGISNQAFGQPSMPGSSGAFGQPSVLGQKPNPFGAPSGGAASSQGGSISSTPFSAFAGTPAPFGAAPQSAPPNPFSHTAQISNPLGQHATTTQPTIYPFAQPAQPTQLAVNPFAQTAPKPSPFGQATGHTTDQPPVNPFGTTTSPSPFSPLSPAAQRTPFGITEQPAQRNPFGLQQQAASQHPLSRPASILKPNPFSQPSAPSNESRPNPFAPSTPTSQQMMNGDATLSPYGPNSKVQHPPPQSYSSRDGNQRLVMFKGRLVVYKNGEAGFQNQDGTWEKIWFPDGPPAYYGATELVDEEYTKDTEAAYKHLQATGIFKDGIMPLLPPKREWCLWDF